MMSPLVRLMLNERMAEYAAATYAPEVIFDIELMLAVEEVSGFQCADPRHAKGQSFHTPDAPAEFVILNPCCSDRGLICRSRAYYLKYQAAMITCWRCKKEWAPGVYRFIPLPGVLPL